MSPVVPGRFTADTRQEIVVFLIGMRVNRFWAVSKWWPTARAMGPMLSVLKQFPEKGYLGHELFYRFFPFEAILVSYWQSFQHLEAFARNTDDPHLQAWQAFNRNIGSDGSVGIWHETYLVPAQQAEAIYVNMPVFGLAAATSHLPMASRHETARKRLTQEEQPQGAAKTD